MASRPVTGSTTSVNNTQPELDALETSGALIDVLITPESQGIRTLNALSSQELEELRILQQNEETRIQREKLERLRRGEPLMTPYKRDVSPS